MSETYTVGTIPEQYDATVMEEELKKIEIALKDLEIQWVYLVPQNNAPARLYNGLVAFADGTNWNPGSGAGLYEYRGGAWNKL